MPDIPLRKQGMYSGPLFPPVHGADKAGSVPVHVPDIYPGVSGPPSPMLLGTIYPPENYIKFLDWRKRYEEIVYFTAHEWENK